MLYNGIILSVSVSVIFHMSMDVLPINNLGEKIKSYTSFIACNICLFSLSLQKSRQAGTQAIVVDCNLWLPSTFSLHTCLEPATSAVLAGFARDSGRSHDLLWTADQQRLALCLAAEILSGTSAIVTGDGEARRTPDPKTHPPQPPEVPSISPHICKNKRSLF